MRTLTVFLVLLGLLLATCSSEPKAEPIGGESYALLQPRSGENYRAYGEFKELAPLFGQQNDTTYVLNFWATWCKPCLEELPHFERLAEKYAGEPLQIVLIALDESPAAQVQLQQFAQRQGLTLPIILLQDSDKKAWQRQVDKRWDGSIPATLVYKNQLRFFANEAFSTYFDLEELVKPLIGS